MKLIKIPRNLFQTWEISELTPEMNLLTSSWKIHNPNYAYFLFNNDERKQFIKKNFNENVYNAYCKIVPGAFKADLWRYCS
jgi:mannosyltransferase OCH1-like enzyme